MEHLLNGANVVCKVSGALAAGVEQQHVGGDDQVARDAMAPDRVEPCDFQAGEAVLLAGKGAVEIRDEFGLPAGRSDRHREHAQAQAAPQPRGRTLQSERIADVGRR